MTLGVVLDDQERCAAWAVKKYKLMPGGKWDRVIGVVNDGVLVGVWMFTSYNGHNAEISFYGNNAVTRGILKVLAHIAVNDLRLSRWTATVPKRPRTMLKKMTKLGFRFEGIQRRFYGPTDHPRHTGCRFVMFREDIMKKWGGIREIA
jgi:hypothetical protein